MKPNHADVCIVYYYEITLILVVASSAVMMVKQVCLSSTWKYQRRSDLVLGMTPTQKMPKKLQESGVEADKGKGGGVDSEQGRGQDHGHYDQVRIHGQLWLIRER